MSPEDRLALRRRCTLVLPGFTSPKPAEEFARLADWCTTHDAQFDVYGKGKLVDDFEARVARLLGKPAAAAFPTGVMAQLAALRIHCEARGLPRFGIHPTSHLAHHEEEAYAALFGYHAVPVGDRLRPIVPDDFAAIAQPLACLIIELPIREAGGQLPSWSELDALKAAARERGIPLHMDGARLWESAAFYGRPHDEIADGFASVYVSLYKGIGAFAGAMLAGDVDFVAQAKLWRRRLGGTPPVLAPIVASAAMRLDDRLALMPSLHARTLALARALAPLAGLRANPPVPQVNMLHLYFDAPCDAVNDARERIAQETGTWIVGDARPAEVPGWSVSELTVGDRLLAMDDEQAASLFARLLEGARQTAV